VSILLKYCVHHNKVHLNNRSHLQKFLAACNAASQEAAQISVVNQSHVSYIRLPTNASNICHSGNILKAAKSQLKFENNSNKSDTSSIALRSAKSVSALS